jgi:hypothetical protein
MFEHLPSHCGIKLVLNSVDHVGMGIAVQQDDAVREFTQTFCVVPGLSC